MDGLTSMTILLPTLAVAFAAICVWLMVRVVNRRERWAKWALAGAIGLPVLYVASFGPACWMTSQHIDALNRGGPPPPRIMLIYGPFLELASEYPLMGAPVYWWGGVGLADDYCAVVPTSAGINMFR